MITRYAESDVIDCVLDTFIYNRAVWTGESRADKEKKNICELHIKAKPVKVRRSKPLQTTAGHHHLLGRISSNQRPSCKSSASKFQSR